MFPTCLVRMKNLIQHRRREFTSASRTVTELCESYIRKVVAHYIPYEKFYVLLGMQYLAFLVLMRSNLHSEHTLNFCFEQRYGLMHTTHHPYFLRMTDYVVGAEERRIRAM